MNSNYRKKWGTLLCGCILLLFCHPAHAQPMLLTGDWKISFEDKAAFGKADYNDTQWESLPKLTWSDDIKKTANRVLWIRKKVFIPSSLKSELKKTGLLV